MIASIVRVKHNVTLLGLVVALVAAGAVPLLAGHEVRAAAPGTTTRRFENTDVRLGFFDGGLASESTIEVSGIGSSVVDVQVSLRDIDFVGDGSQDMDVLLIGPNGGTAMILSDVGGTTPTRDVFLLLRDGASQRLPADAALITGTFEPTNIAAQDTFKTGGGVFTPPSDSSLRNAFVGSTPNGTWRLFAFDDTTNGIPAAGSGINGGWGLIITTANGRPTAEPDRFQAQAGKTLRVPAVGVLKNDADPDDDRLSAILAKKPTQGKVTLRRDGSFTYTPNKTAKGTDRFTYRAQDPAGASAAATVTIQIKA